jgi:hypothetical protein
MTTVVQPMKGTRTGLVLAWSVTVMAILGIGLVVATAPLPQLSAAASSGTAASTSAGAPAGTQLSVLHPDA